MIEKKYYDMAVQMVIDSMKDNNMTVEDLCWKSGFNSRSPWYHFKNRECIDILTIIRFGIGCNLPADKFELYLSYCNIVLDSQYEINRLFWEYIYANSNQYKTSYWISDVIGIIERIPFSKDRLDVLYNTLTNAREASGLTVQDATNRICNTTRNPYYNLFKGKYSPDTIILLALACNVPASQMRGYLTAANIAIDYRFGGINAIFWAYVFSHNTSDRASYDINEFNTILNDLGYPPLGHFSFKEPRL